MRSVGIERTSYCVGVLGFSSMLTLTTLTLPAYSPASCSTTGAIARHGPHQVAQKSIEHRLRGLEHIGLEAGVGDVGNLVASHGFSLPHATMPGLMKTSRLWCVLALLVGVFVLHHEVLVGWDELDHSEDAADGYYPSHVAILRALAHGELPTWERGSWAGWPLAVDPYYGLYYPLSSYIFRLWRRARARRDRSPCTPLGAGLAHAVADAAAQARLARRGAVRGGVAWRSVRSWS